MAALLAGIGAGAGVGTAAGATGLGGMLGQLIGGSVMGDVNHDTSGAAGNLMQQLYPQNPNPNAGANPTGTQMPASMQPQQADPVTTSSGWGQGFHPLIAHLLGQ